MKGGKAKGDGKGEVMRRESDPGEEIEYAGCQVFAGQWIKIGLSKHQAMLLKEAAGSMLKPCKRPSASMAWLLLNTALSHLEIMEWLLRHEPNGDGIFQFGEGHWEQKAAARVKRLN